MDHNISLITTIAAAFGVALVFGMLAARMKLPPLVGYLVGGIVIGPWTPGFVADVGLSQQLAEIGVMLLMFGVGLHFSLDDLLSVRRIALPGALVQIAVATAMGMGMAEWLGWDFGTGVVFGLALSVASTVVLLKALERLNAVDSLDGRIAVGWLVVEDMVMVLVLVLLPALAPWLSGEGEMQPSKLVWSVAVTLGQVGLFVGLMLVVGKRLFPWLLWQVAATGSRELFTLCVVAAALGIAYGSSAIFGVSFALGAFFAGMVLRESDLSYRAAEESLPLRDAFSVLFFVSVGMLFDPGILLRAPLQVLAVVLIIVVGKSLAAFAIVLAFRYPLSTALTVSASLAQIGEFSFILAGLGLTLKLISAEVQSLIVAGALISIALNPLAFAVIERLRARFESAPEGSWQRKSVDPLAELPMDTPAERLSGQVVMVGYGRVGSQMGKSLMDQGLSLVVAEENREIVQQLRERGLAAVAGDAAEPGVLIQAHIARASVLVIATPDAFAARKMMQTARALNPQVYIIARSHGEEDADLLRQEGANAVFVAEHEVADSMVREVVARMREVPAH
jgi:CPA2 family monovalent cation:H+ antiporter-2